MCGQLLDWLGTKGQQLRITADTAFHRNTHAIPMIEGSASANTEQAFTVRAASLDY